LLQGAQPAAFHTTLQLQATEFQRMKWTVLNSAVALCGYWAAAALVDKKWYGRLRMQSNGFFMMFVLFITCGLAFPWLTASAQGLRVFQFLYFLSSFWNQVGPT
jgi:hypothetical protein